MLQIGYHDLTGLGHPLGILFVDADVIGQLVSPVNVVLITKELLLDVLNCLIDHLSRDGMRVHFGLLILGRLKVLQVFYHLVSLLCNLCDLLSTQVLAEVLSLVNLFTDLVLSCRQRAVVEAQSWA